MSVSRDTALTGQFSADGSPWVRVAAKNGIELDTLEYSLDGSPWWGIEDAAAVSSYIKTVNALAKASVKTVNSLAMASVKTMNGLT